MVMYLSLRSQAICHRIWRMESIPLQGLSSQPYWCCDVCGQPYMWPLVPPSNLLVLSFIVISWVFGSILSFALLKKKKNNCKIWWQVILRVWCTLACKTSTCQNFFPTGCFLCELLRVQDPYEWFPWKLVDLFWPYVICLTFFGHSFVL